ncbi:MAG: lipopolysaccharide biosynthesis protein [Bacillota bacterium]
MSEWKRFIKSSGIYFLGNMLSKLVYLFLLPLYTRYLIPEDYGYYDLTIAYLSVATSVLFLDIWNAVLRFMFDYSKIEEKYKVAYSGSVIFVGSIIVFLLLLLVINIFIDIKYFYYVMMYGVLTTLQSYYSSVIRGIGRNVVFAISGVVVSFVGAGFNVFLITQLHMDYSSIYLSGIISIAIQLIILEANMRLIQKFSYEHIDMKIVKRLFIYAAPLCINSLSFWLLTSYNRIAVGSFLSVYENGLYSIAGRISSILIMLSMCFSLAWQETAFSKKGTNEERGIFFSKALDLYLKTLIFSTILLLPMIWFAFPIIVDSTYADSKNYVPLYLVGTMLSILSGFLGSIFGNIMKTKIIFISTLIGALVNVVTIQFLMNIYGGNGANISLILGFFATALIRIIFLRKIIFLQVNVKLLVIGVVLIYVYIQIYKGFNGMMNLIFFFLSLLFALLCFRREILEILESRKRRS